ncbi:MAG: phage holin family protein [Rhodocyclaceae bacterium]|nr:phage holin family protein [Rhodocyclaceae bacterium]
MSERTGLYASLRGFVATAVAIVRTRLELVKLEVQEEVGRILALFAWAIAAVLLGLAGVVFLAVFLTVLVWESHRLLALGLFAALFFGAAGLAFAAARRLVRQGSQLFAASLAELKRDAAGLGRDGERP